ncbi:MAG: hypothetical protein U1F64_03230 [Burkholderiales bacterium]
MAVTLCPIAIAVGCRKCPIFKVCPLKGVIGDQRGAPAAPRESASTGSGASRRPASAPPKPKAKRKGSRARRRER